MGVHHKKYFECDKLMEEWWLNDEGDYHREDGPALIKYFSNRAIQLERWYLDGKTHRDNDLPAEIEYAEDGTILSQYWVINAQYHRYGGPAILINDCYGNIIQKCWLINNRYHREDGPAMVNYLLDRSIIYDYYLNDNKITDFVKKIFGYVPDELTKDQAVLLKLSIPCDFYNKYVR